MRFAELLRTVNKVLAGLMAQANETSRSARHWQHHSAERGNAVRSFEGTGFIAR